MPFPGHIPNADLTLAQVPERDADWGAIRNLAYTFDAYDHYGGNGPVAWIANRQAVGTLTEARTCLFFEHRRLVHSPDAFDSSKKQSWVRELVARIRMFVEKELLDDERVFNRDLTLYLRWQKAHRDDLGDHDTIYEIAVFDAVTMEAIARFPHTHNSETTMGQPLYAVSWAEDGKVLFLYGDGGAARVALTKE